MTSETRIGSICVPTNEKGIKRKVVVRAVGLRERERKRKREIGNREYIYIDVVSRVWENCDARNNRRAERRIL